MRRVILLSTTLLLASSISASAGEGLNLRWSNCFGDGGTLNRNFACNVNTGSNVLVSSFVLGAPILQASGNEVVIDIASAAPSLPSWWAFKNVGTCRQTSMSVNFVVSSAAVACVDWASGAAAGGIGAYNVGVAGPTTARIIMALAVPISGLSDLAAGQEYFSNNVLILNTKTVGTGACAGCDVPVCLVLLSLKVTTPTPVNDRRLFGPTNGTDSHYATWQGGVGAVSFRGSGCPNATRTREQTWGAVKALYR